MQQQDNGQQRQDSSQKMVIVATIAFIVGFGLAWLILSQREGGSVPTNDQATTTSESVGTNAPVGDAMTGDASTSADSIRVSDQPEGVTVAIDQVMLDRVGWVVIHEDDNGTPSRILGAQLFDTGTRSGTVDLLRGTLAGHRYYAMLHTDNGDHAFDPKKDTPILGSDGSPVMVTFIATAAAQ